MKTNDGHGKKRQWLTEKCKEKASLNTEHSQVLRKPYFINEWKKNY